MARPKKVMKVQGLAEDEEEVTVQPKRSTRKRKVINYAEPQAEDSDWIENTPEKKRDNKAVTVGTRASLEGNNVGSTGMRASVVLDDDSEEEDLRPKRKLAPKRVRVRDDEIEYDEDGEEIRKRQYQDYPPERFEAKLERALSQPIAVTSRQRVDNDDYPSETFDMTGSDEIKKYKVEIKLVSKCSCGDFVFRRQSCKHIIYVLNKVLKVSQDSHLLYQLAFTSNELKEILTEENTAPVAAPEDLYRDGKRKLIEGECPVCYMDFEPEKQRIVYCKAQCGNNVHETCMRTWIASQTQMYGKATCPLCRNNWVH